MLEFPQPAITKSRTAKAGATSRRGQQGKPNLISLSCNRVRLSGRAKVKRYFWGACASGGVSTCIEQVLAALASYFAVLAARKKLTSRLLILLVSREKEECHSFVVRVMDASSVAGLVSGVHFCSLMRYCVVTGSYGHEFWPTVKPL